jgi:hypothetical protein
MRWNDSSHPPPKMFHESPLGGACWHSQPLDSEPSVGTADRPHCSQFDVEPSSIVRMSSAAGYRTTVCSNQWSLSLPTLASDFVTQRIPIVRGVHALLGAEQGVEAGAESISTPCRRLAPANTTVAERYSRRDLTSSCAEALVSSVLMRMPWRCSTGGMKCSRCAVSQHGKGSPHRRPWLGCVHWLSDVTGPLCTPGRRDLVERLSAALAAL